MNKKRRSSSDWRKLLLDLDRHDPQKAACLLYAKWFQVSPLAVAERELPWLSKAVTQQWQTSLGTLPGFLWPGSGPQVLLLHGWGGRATQMGYLAQQLSQAEFQCIAFDAPGHGDAPGSSTNVLQMRQALAEIIEQQGEVDTVVTHSYSLVAALLACRELGAKFNKLVTISPSAQPMARFEGYIQALGIGEATQQAFQQMLAQHLDSNWWQRISPLQNVQACHLNGLIIHDQQDRIVPVAEGRELHQVWQDSILVETEGLGHMRILSAPEVAQTVRDFL